MPVLFGFDSDLTTFSSELYCRKLKGKKIFKLTSKTMKEDEEYNDSAFGIVITDAERKKVRELDFEEGDTLSDVIPNFQQRVFEIVWRKSGKLKLEDL